MIERLKGLAKAIYNRLYVFYLFLTDIGVKRISAFVFGISLLAIIYFIITKISGFIGGASVSLLIPAALLFIYSFQIAEIIWKIEEMVSDGISKTDIQREARKCVLEYESSFFNHHKNLPVDDMDVKWVSEGSDINKETIVLADEEKEESNICRFLLQYAKKAVLSDTLFIRNDVSIAFSTLTTEEILDQSGRSEVRDWLDNVVENEIKRETTEDEFQGRYSEIRLARQQGYVGSILLSEYDARETGYENLDEHQAASVVLLKELSYAAKQGVTREFNINLRDNTDFSSDTFKINVIKVSPARSVQEYKSLVQQAFGGGNFEVVYLLAINTRIPKAKSIFENCKQDEDFQVFSDEHSTQQVYKSMNDQYGTYHRYYGRIVNTQYLH